MENKKQNVYPTLDNIIFRYLEGVGNDIERETAFRNRINHCLSPLIEKINKQKGIIVAEMLPTTQNIKLENIPNDLSKEITMQLRKFDEPF